MQNILILGAGKSSTILIEYLLSRAAGHDWTLHVADLDPSMARQKTANHPRAAVHGIEPGNSRQIDELVASASLVISMLPPPLHPAVAASCVKHGRHFLNASYLTPEIQALDAEVQKAGLSFICEAGLDPGIDHMSAMELINEIRDQGGRINSFHSHCGGLIAPESDDNPWHYKISWNPRNIILAGKDGARYLENNQVRQVGYKELFDASRTVHVPGMGDYAWYPNRDSLSYIPVYHLEEAGTFMRTTLRHPDFCSGWEKIVALGFTDDSKKYDTTGMDIRSFFLQLLAEKGLPHWKTLVSDPITRNQFEYLQLDSREIINRGSCSAADVLQWIMERKLGLQEADRDMIIMLHEIGFTLGGQQQVKKSSLVVKGEDSLHTAMAKTVGLPLAIAAEKILDGTIRRKGVCIPIYNDVYEPVLEALENEGICFTTA